MLLPLGRTLMCMKAKLLEAYRSFEETSDDPNILAIVEDLETGLKFLDEGTKGVSAALPGTRPKRTGDEADPVIEANEVLETTCERCTMEVLSMDNAVEEQLVSIRLMIWSEVRNGG